jgi:hypothetical protein
MIKVLDSFIVRDRGIIAILQHQENGIPPDTILSEKENPEITWKVKARVLNGTLLVEEKEICFENETELTHTSPIFTDTEKRKKAVSKLIKDRENNVFEYILYSKKDTSKPIKDSILILPNV